MATAYIETTVPIPGSRHPAPEKTRPHHPLPAPSPGDPCDSLLRPCYSAPSPVLKWLGQPVPVSSIPVSSSNHPLPTPCRKTQRPPRPKNLRHPAQLVKRPRHTGPLMAPCKSTSPEPAGKHPAPSSFTHFPLGSSSMEP